MYFNKILTLSTTNKISIKLSNNNKMNYKNSFKKSSFKWPN